MKINKFNLIISIIIILFSAIFFTLFSGSITYDTQYSESEYYSAKVVTISSIESQSDEIVENTGFGDTLVVEFVARITEGDMDGDTVTALQYHDDYLYESQRIVEVGDSVILTKTMANDIMADTWIMANYDRSILIIFAVAVFLLLIIIIGRFKGVGAILSLAFTMCAIFIVYIPSLLAGYNVYLITGAVTVYIIIMSLLLLNGVNSKTYCAILGNIMGVLIAAVLAFAANKLFMITGVMSQEHIYLAYLGKNMGFSLNEIIWSGVVIGALGAIMDVSMSISSSMKELSDNMESPTMFKLLKSGFNIGRDIIGTMMNTLVLAYIGSSLVMVLLITVYNENMLTILNSELILVEVIQAIIGSMGILLTVPFTVIICSYSYAKSKNQENIIKDDYLFNIIPLNEKDKESSDNIDKK